MAIGFYVHKRFSFRRDEFALERPSCCQPGTDENEEGGAAISLAEPKASEPITDMSFRPSSTSLDFYSL